MYCETRALFKYLPAQLRLSKGSKGNKPCLIYNYYFNRHDTTALFCHGPKRNVMTKIRYLHNIITKKSLFLKYFFNYKVVLLNPLKSA